MPNGKKHKRHKMATHKRKKRLRKNRHKSKYALSSMRQGTNIKNAACDFEFVLCRFM